jgi:hypothetical protein
VGQLVLSTPSVHDAKHTLGVALILHLKPLQAASSAVEHSSVPDTLQPFPELLHTCVLSTQSLDAVVQVVLQVVPLHFNPLHSSYNVVVHSVQTLVSQAGLSVEQLVLSTPSVHVV